MIDTADLWVCPTCRGLYVVSTASARRHRKYEADKADPERYARLRKRHRANQKRYAKANPERARAAHRRWLERQRNDEQRRCEKNADQRMNHRLRAERDGREVKRRVSVEAGYRAPTAKGEHLDPAPLREWLAECFPGFEPGAIAKACRVTPRLIFTATHDEWVSLHTADCIFTGYGRPDLLNHFYPVP